MSHVKAPKGESSTVGQCVTLRIEKSQVGIPLMCLAGLWDQAKEIVTEIRQVKVEEVKVKSFDICQIN